MTRMLSAQEYFADIEKVRKVNRCLSTIARLHRRVQTHEDYMEIAEDYADYVCRYEKEYDRAHV